MYSYESISDSEISVNTFRYILTSIAILFVSKRVEKGTQSGCFERASGAVVREVRVLFVEEFGILTGVVIESTRRGATLLYRAVRHGSNILIGLLDRALTIPAVAGMVGTPEIIFYRADDIPEYAVIFADIRRSGRRIIRRINKWDLIRLQQKKAYSDFTIRICLVIQLGLEPRTPTLKVLCSTS